MINAAIGSAKYGLGATGWASSYDRFLGLS